MGVFTQKHKKSRKSRKIIVLLLLCLALVLLLRFGPGYLLGGAQLRQEIETQLTKTFGTPVRIERIDLSFFPAFRVRFYGIHAGEEALQFHADTCDVFMDWHQLFQRKIRITTVSVPRMQAVISGEYTAASASLNRIVDTMQQHQQKSQSSEKRVQVALESVTVETFHLVANNREVAVGTMHVKNLTEPEIALTVEATTVNTENMLDMTAALQLKRGGSQSAMLTGQAALTFSRQFTVSRTGTPIRVAGELHSMVSGNGLNDIAFRIEGDAAIGSGDAVTQGTFDAKAWWQQDAFIVNDLRWHSPGLELLADATIPLDETEPALHLYHAEMQPPLTQAVLDSLQLPMLNLHASENAVITITDLLSGMQINPVPRLVSGSITATGISVTNSDGQTILPNLQLEATVTEGKIALQKMNGGGWSITGAIVPDVAAGEIAYQLQASGMVKKEHVQVLSPTVAHRLDTFSGNLQLEEITGVYTAGNRKKELPHCKGRLTDVHVALRQNAATTPVPLPQMDIAFLFEDNVLSLEELAFGESRLQGKVSAISGNMPEATLSGSIQLGDIPASIVPAAVPLQHLKGYLDITTLSMSLYENTTTPIRMDGTLRNVSGTALTPLFNDQLSGFSGSVNIEGSAIHLTLTGTSEHLDVLLGEGVYDIAAHHAAGEIHLDLGTAAGTLLPESSWRIPVAGIIADTYGQTGFTFTADFPSDTSRAGTIELRSQNAPLLYYQSELVHDTTGYHLGERQLQSAIPLPIVLKHVNLQREVSGANSFPLETEGLVHVRYEQGGVGMPYVLSLDATSCSVRWNPWLYKDPETPLRALIQGTGLQVETVALMLDEQPLTLYHNGMGNFQARDETVPLERLNRFVAPDIRLAGEALISFNTQPLYVQTQLANVQVTILEEQLLSTINGIVIHDEAETQLRGISLHGNGFACQLEATRNEKVWQASLQGNRFDVNRLMDANEALAKLRGLDSPRITGMTMPNITGMLEINLEEVAYKRGLIKKVQGTAQLAPEIITSENLTFRMGQGTVSGRARIQPEHAGIRKPTSIYADLQVDAVDIAHGEKLIFKKERDLSGLASGTVEFQIPTGKESFRRMDGKFQLHLWNGSLGKLGFASRLIGLLRNREIVLLRMPSFQDEGLTYDEAQVRVSMRNGFAQLEHCTAGSPSYTIVATGPVDFARMQTDVQVTLDIFQGVAGLIEHLPVIGPTATSVVKEATRIRLRATGPPFDIQWQPDVIP